MTSLAKLFALALVGFSAQLTLARAESAEDWIALGTRVHGAFGAFIPVGLRIGLDAQERLKTNPRGLIVTYHNGSKAPCPCIADGVMLATGASPGQGTLHIASEAAAEGELAKIVIRSRKTGEGFIYTVSNAWLPKIAEWNKSFDPAGRYDAALKAEALYEVVPAPAPQ